MDRIGKVAAVTDLTQIRDQETRSTEAAGIDTAPETSTDNGSSAVDPQTESEPVAVNTNVSDVRTAKSTEQPLVSLYRNNQEVPSSTSQHAFRPNPNDAELPSDPAQVVTSQRSQSSPGSNPPKNLKTKDVLNVREPGGYRRISEKRQAELLPDRLASSETALTAPKLGARRKSDSSDVDEDDANYVDKCSYYEFTQDDLEKTFISNWYPKFASVTQKTIFLAIPPDVLEYLNTIGCNLPKNTDTSVMNSLPRSNSNDTLMSSSYESTEEEERRVRASSTSSSDEETAPKSLPHSFTPGRIFDKFDDFDKEIESAIKKLGGSVLPKLNWKSPKDAVWIGFNKCMRSFMPGDIYLLFKASNYISDILSEPYKYCLNYNPDALPSTLVLRKWIDISPAAEFRCFVTHHLLVGICQRDTSGCYPTIYDERDLIISDIHRFYRENLFLKVGLDSFVFDVVRFGDKEVKLIDINLFGLVTNSLLFSYRGLQRIYHDNLNDGDSRLADEDEAAERLRSGKKAPEPLPSYDSLPDVSTYGDPVFRFIEKPGLIRAHPYLSSGAPHDLRLKLQMPVENPRIPIIQDPFLEHASGHTGI